MDSPNLPDLQTLAKTVQALDGFFDWDLSISRIYFSPKWKSQAGYEPDEVKDEPDEWYRLIEPADRETVRSHIASHLEGLTPQLNVEYRLIHRDGSPRWMLCRGLVGRDAAGKPQRLTGIQTDITEQKLAERQILKDAFRDSLTGLSNRALFLDRLERVVLNHKRYPKELFAVISLDLKPVLAGGVPGEWETLEPVLALASQSLQKGLRTCDTLARVGGSEFVVLLGRIQEAADTTKVLERLRLLAGHSYPLDEQEVYVSIQSGVAVSDDSDQSAETLLEAARTARHTNASVQTSSSRRSAKGLDEKSLAQITVLLKEAVQREDFRVQYLPWISLETGRLAGFEALVRWKRVADELVVGPAEFLEAAEQSGLLPAIESQILMVAARKICDWNKNFKRPQPLFISVNICGSHLVDFALPQAVQKSFTLTNLPPEGLILECPEKDLQRYPDRAVTIMSALSKMGVRWAVDDFGQDDCFFSAVTRLPLSFLKMNGEILAQAQQGDGPASRSQSLVNKSRALGLKLVAKGVENGKQFEIAKAWGCGYAQGFFFSRPLDESGVWGLLTADPQW